MQTQQELDTDKMGEETGWMGGWRSCGAITQATPTPPG